MSRNLKNAAGNGNGEPPKSEPGEGWGVTLALLARLTGIGWYVAISITLGAVGGWWLDGRFDTKPWLTLVGVGLGVVIAFSGMIRLLRAFGSSDTPDKPAGGQGQERD